MDGVIKGLDIIDMGPEKELALRQPGDGDPDMMKRKQFVRPEAFFAIEQVTISNAQAEMDAGRHPIPLRQHHQTDPQEKNDLDHPEKKVDPGQLSQDLAADSDQEKDIQGNDQHAPEIKAGRLLPVEMAEGMGQDQEPGGYMQPAATAF